MKTIPRARVRRRHKELIERQRRDVLRLASDTLTGRSPEEAAALLPSKTLRAAITRKRIKETCPWLSQGERDRLYAIKEALVKQ